MFFWGKRPALQSIRVKRPTVFSLPGFSTAPLGPDTQVEETERAMALLRQYLQACRADAYFSFFLPSVDIVKPYLDLYPEEKTLLRQLAQQERCGASVGVNHPFAALVGGEALIRNLLLGQFFHETQLRLTSKTSLIRGIDALFPQLPQIYRQCGLLAALIRHEDDQESLVSAPELFHWMAPNGDSILIRRVLEPPRDAPLPERAEGALEAERGIRTGSMAAILLELEGSNPPSGEWIGAAREHAKREPSIQCMGAAAQRYFAYINSAPSGADPSSSLRLAHDFFASRAWRALARHDLKVASRLAENLLYEAETWTAFAESLQIQTPRNALGLAWRQLIFAQNRQALLGLDNELSVIDLLDILRETLELAESQRGTSIKAISKHVATAGEAPYAALIFNSLPWPCDAVFTIPESLLGGIEDYALVDPLGGEITCEIEAGDSNSASGHLERQTTYLCRNLPAAGYLGLKRLEASPERAPYIKKAQSQPWLENEYLRVEIDPDRGGGVISLVDKETEREFISPNAPFPANSIAWLEEISISASREAPALRIQEQSGDSHADVRYYEGPISRRLVIRAGGPGPCARIQELRLYEGMPFLDCVTVLQDYSSINASGNQEVDQAAPDLFMALFPLALPGARPVFEDRFYAKSGRLSPTNFSSLRHREASGVYESMDIGLRWVDVSWSFLIRFMEGATEIASLALGPCSIISPLNRFHEARQRLAAFLARHGVMSTPRHSLDENGALPGGMYIFVGSREEHPAIQRQMERIPEADAYYEQSMRQLGYAIMVLPLYNPNRNEIGSAALLIAGDSEARIQQAVDEIAQSTVAHRWDCPASSLFIPNLPVVEDAGAALLTRAPAICALDQEGTLGLGLMRAAPYSHSATHWPHGFAEQKTNVFQYRLFPHAGDWRHAEIPRRAMEYNHPPVAMPVEAHAGVLPPRISFLSLEPANVLVSSIKSAGFDEAAAIRSTPDRKAIILRMVEAHGEESNIWVECVHPVRKVKSLSIDEQPPYEKREIFREDQFIRGTIHANEISTLQLSLRPEMYARTQVEGARPPFRLPSRYWRQNAGILPEGYTPLSVMLRGAIRQEGHDFDATVHHLDLVVVNHSGRESISGETLLNAPPYFRLIPNRISYRIEPGAFQVIPFRVVMTGTEREGFIRARTEYREQIVEDTIRVGASPEFDLRMTLNRDGFHIHLRHPYPHALNGIVRLVAPIESWPQTLVGEYALGPIFPRRQDFEVAHGEEITLTFSVAEIARIHRASADHHWIAIKLATHHTLRYYHIRLDGRASEGLGRILVPPYVD